MAADLRITLEASKAFAEHYKHVRMVSSVANEPLPVSRQTPVWRYAVPRELDCRPPAPSRDPCPRCQTRGDLGCEHQAPYTPLPPTPVRLNINGHRIHARHRK